VSATFPAFAMRTQTATDALAMKILFDHPNPFALAHGGLQVQIEQTKRGLEQIGIEVEWLRWWDDAQDADVIHYFGRPTTSYVQFAQRKGMKVVIAELLTGLGSRSGPARWAQAHVIRGLRRVAFLDRMNWNTYSEADAYVALTAWEAHLMQAIFGAPAAHVHIVPNGVEEVFFDAPPVERGPWLICTATITERKRVLELARAAVCAATPLWVVGRPYSDDDPYYRTFLELARAHPQTLRYEGAVNDRSQLAAVYRAARGFVLLSTKESLSLSALEATACACPMLLSDLPWARTTFGNDASYCPATASVQTTAAQLRVFYDRCPQLAPAPRPLTWQEIGTQLATLYRQLADRTEPSLTR
jgi:glycosyltransferase involved in cell wall biosynthesis